MRIAAIEGCYLNSENVCKKCGCSSAIIKLELDEKDKRGYVLPKLTGVYCKDCYSIISDDITSLETCPLVTENPKNNELWTFMV